MRASLLLLLSLLFACERLGGPDGADGSQADGADTSTLSPAAIVDLAADSLAADHLMAHVGYLADDALKGRENGSPGAATAREHIIGRLKSVNVQPGGEVGWLQTFPTGINVVGVLPGSDPVLADQYVVVGAHYDHLGEVGAGACKANEKLAPGDTICNGALDNAAGVAVLLEVARALVQAKVPLRRSVMFCFFDAEEDGLVGSKYFVNHAKPLAPLADIAAMFSVDLVGGQIFPGEPSSFAVDIEYSTGLRPVVLDAASAVNMKVWPVSAFFVGKEDGGRSDHYPFRKKGVPVLFFGSGSPPIYHTPADEPDEVDQVKLLGTARHVLRVVASVANADDRPVFVDDPKPHLGDAEAMVFLADQILANPKKVGLAGNDAALTLVKKWRDQLAAYVAKPPVTDDEWAEYDKLVRTIVTTAFAVLGA